MRGGGLASAANYREQPKKRGLLIFDFEYRQSFPGCFWTATIFSSPPRGGMAARGRPLAGEAADAMAKFQV
jgi:hypothetical protein